MPRSDRNIDQVRKLFELCQEFGVAVYEDGEFRVAFDHSKAFNRDINADKKERAFDLTDKVKAPEGADPRLIEFIRASGGDIEIES